MNESRALIVTVCDDVRQEVGNKFSFMGVYEKSIVLTKFPATLPKLCFLLQARTLCSRPFEKLTFKILRNDEPIAVVELPEEQLLAFQEKNVPSDENPELRMIVKIVAQVAPLQLSKPGKLRFRAITESEELKGDSLLIQQAV